MNTQQRIEDSFADTFAECQADLITPPEVVDAFVSALEGLDQAITELSLTSTMASLMNSESEFVRREPCPEVWQ